MVKSSRRTNGRDNSSDTVLAPTGNGGGSLLRLGLGPCPSPERDEAYDDVLCELPDVSYDVDASSLAGTRVNLGGLRGGKLKSLGVSGWERPFGVSVVSGSSVSWNFFVWGVAVSDPLITEPSCSCVIGDCLLRVLFRARYLLKRRWCSKFLTSVMVTEIAVGGSRNMAAPSNSPARVKEAISKMLANGSDCEPRCAIPVP